MKQIYQNKYDIPLSLALWLATDEYEASTITNSISATTLLKPLKSVILSLQNPAIQKKMDIYDKLSSRMGTSIHSSIEKAWLLSGDLTPRLESLGIPENIIKCIKINPSSEEIKENTIPIYLEQRYNKQLQEFNITGQIDFCCKGKLDDIKSTSAWSWVFGGNDEAYQKQGSIYRWLAPEIITDDFIYIRYIFTDWSKSKALQDRKYPQQRTLNKEIPLLSLQETENFILGQLSTIRQYISITDQEKLPICTATELWQDKPVWKYYKDRNKLVRATKNFNNSAEAQQRYHADGAIGFIKFVPGKVKRCLYCPVVDICSQAQNYITTGLLEI